MLSAPDLQEAALRLVPEGRGGLRWTALPGGGNNRLTRVDSPAGAFVLKHYFRHPEDPRDRLAAEFAFSTFAWDAGLRALPRPVAADPEVGLGLYAFVPGRRLEPGEVGAPEVQEASAFLKALQAHRDAPAARALPAASAACFSLDAHVVGLERRLERLAQIQAPEARAFVASEMLPAWAHLRTRLLREPGRDHALPPEGRILSPSDFGFHNALRTEAGSLVFLDFEYAGWDDPAKTVGDFFSQVAVPVPAEAFDPFAKDLASLLPDPEGTLRRMRLLRPLYRLVWVGIVLNYFLPVDQDRRAFAGEDTASQEGRAAQLAKARGLLKVLPEEEP